MNKSHVVVVDGRFVGAAVRGRNEFRFVAVDDSVRALDATVWPSLAALQQAAWQGAGIGSQLMEHALLSARNRNIGKVYMNCLASNRSMQRLAQSHGAAGNAHRWRDRRAPDR
eukprot:gene32391-biopygen20903